VGASFVETLMNIEDVLQLRDVKAWHAGSGTKDLGLSKPVWRVPGNERFKALVAELRLLLEDAEPRLSELERSLPWHVAHGEHDSPARDALVARIKKEVVVEFVRASEEIDTALRTSSTADRQALKEYSQRQLHAFMMQSPWMHRAREKPLGYPGDYEVMNGLYGSHFAGATLFAKAVNMWAVSTGAAAAVRARKDLLRTELGRAVGTTAPPTRILSIAAGPAQEIYELLEELETIARPIEIVLFDQDKRALAFSYGRLKRLLSAKRHEAVQVTHLHDSIKRLLRDGRLFEGYGKFDVIYCSGLFDYLQLPTAVHLCRNLFRNLALGGRLYVGNMVPANPSRWIMEFHLDWFLHYRERSELIDLARMAVPEADIELLEEVVGVNPFVSMRRS
jgi:SAM-dependent methyltransferase